MDGNCGWFQKNSLHIMYVVGNTKELLFVEQHLLAPSTAYWLWAGQSAVLTEAIMARGARAAGLLYACCDAVGSRLQNNPVTDT
jgi:hypothetical protein